MIPTCVFMPALHVQTTVRSCKLYVCDLIFAPSAWAGSGQEERHGCEFGEFFLSPPDGTPPELLRCGIYSTIAVPMKGSAWREASMAMLAQALDAAAPAGERQKPEKLDRPTIRRDPRRLPRFQRGRLATEREAEYGSATCSSTATTSVPDVTMEVSSTAEVCMHALGGPRGSAVILLASIHPPRSRARRTWQRRP